jgi:hypothetical protein
MSFEMVHNILETANWVLVALTQKVLTPSVKGA